MVDTGQEEETFDPLEIGMYLFSYESPVCLEFEQRTRPYGTPNLQDEIAEPISFLLDRKGLVKRWHVCEPIHVTYDDRNGEDCGMWLICDPNLKFCFRYNEVFGVHYSQQKINDTTRERRYYEWVAQNYEFSKHRTHTSINLNDPVPTPQEHQELGNDEPRPVRPRPCNYSFEEWMKIKIGHNNLRESDREFIFNEWILDSYDVKEEYAREIGDPYSRRFNEYNRVFNNEIEHLSNEYWYERITKKRTKNKAKTTKPGTEWKSCEGQSQIKAKDQKSQSQSQLNKLTVKTGAIIMVNVIPPDHVDDVPVVEPNQHDGVSIDPEPVLVDEDEDPKEDEFEEEEDPQEEEDDMEVDIKEDENEPELTYPYEEVDTLNLPPPASESELGDEIKVEDAVESEDETVPASVHEIGESSTAPFLREDGIDLLPGLMRRDINSLFGQMASLSRRLCGRKTTHA
ncbi:hypothetical protein Tco_0231110, partial [Tanacetum coccineum]